MNKPVVGLCVAVAAFSFLFFVPVVPGIAVPAPQCVAFPGCPVEISLPPVNGTGSITRWAFGIGGFRYDRSYSISGL